MIHYSSSFATLTEYSCLLSFFLYHPQLKWFQFKFQLKGDFKMPITAASFSVALACPGLPGCLSFKTKRISFVFASAASSWRLCCLPSNFLMLFLLGGKNVEVFPRLPICKISRASNLTPLSALKWFPYGI